jgi:hypothetical protein
MVKKGGGGARDRIIMELMYLNGLVIMRTRNKNENRNTCKKSFSRAYVRTAEPQHNRTKETTGHAGNGYKDRQSSSTGRGRSGLPRRGHSTCHHVEDGAGGHAEGQSTSVAT